MTKKDDAPKKNDAPRCLFCQSHMKAKGNRWVCDCGRGYMPRKVPPTPYSPGPWTVDEENSDMVLGKPPEEWYPTPQEPRYIVVQTGAYVCTPLNERGANARLIAAAPEMLEALKAVVSTYRTFRNVPKDQQDWTSLDEDALNAAFAAIEKAEGK